MKVLAIALLALGISSVTGAKSYGVSTEPKGKAKVTNAYANMFGYKVSKHKGKKVRDSCEGASFNALLCSRRASSPTVTVIRPLPRPHSRTRTIGSNIALSRF